MRRSPFDDAQEVQRAGARTHYHTLQAVEQWIEGRSTPLRDPQLPEKRARQARQISEVPEAIQCEMEHAARHRQPGRRISPRPESWERLRPPDPWTTPRGEALLVAEFERRTGFGRQD